MKPESTRRVVEPTAPPMTDAEFHLQLERHSRVMEGIRKPEQQRKSGHFPDLARATAALANAFEHAEGVRGSHNATAYHLALVGVRRAIGTWSNIDARFGPLRPSGVLA